MSNAFRRLTLLGTLLLAASCASAPREGREAPRDPNVIVREQLAARSFQNAYDAVQTLKGNWLRTRGTDSMNTPSQIWVYVDETRVGGIETLRNVAVSDIGSIRRHDAVAATARWGLGHGQGAIQVMTRSR